MSRYNNYAKELDAIFKEARADYTKAYKDFEAAKAALEVAQHPTKAERFIGEREAELMKAKAKYMEAEAEYNKVKVSAIENFRTKRDQLSSQFMAEVKKNSIVSTDGIDPNGLELLKSGVMSVDDYNSFMKQYDGNPTMLKLISKYSSEAANNNKAKEHERVAFLKIANEAASGDSAIVRKWNSLCNTANTFIGQNHSNPAGRFVCEISKRWDDPRVSQSVEDF